MSTTNIKLDPIVKSKLDKFKKESGSKTYSEAVNLLLLAYYPIKEFLEDIKS